MLSSPATAAGLGSTPQRPPFEVADVVREYGEGFRTTLHISHEQEKVLRAIVQCQDQGSGLALSLFALRAGDARGRVSRRQEKTYNSRPDPFF